MSAKRLYVDAVSNELDLGGRWIANWPPGIEVRLGMVGEIEDNGFVQEGHLSDGDRAVPFETDDTSDRPDGYDFATRGAVKVFAKAKGETSDIIPHVPKLSAGFKIQFEKENAVAVRFDNVVQRRIKSEKALAKEIIAAWHDGERMEMGDIVIVAVLDTASGIAATSASKSAEVEAAVSAEIGTGPISLGDITGEVNIAYKSGTDFETTMGSGNVFAYRAVKLTRDGVFGLRVQVQDVLEAVVEDAEPTIEEDEPVLTMEEYAAEAPTRS
jgi:hypothetical protein